MVFQPSTLEGTKENYEDILRRIDKLTSFGEEPAKFHSLLKPVITRFIRSFDEPEAPEVIDFWQKIAAEETLGSGRPYIAGWLTAFCFWNKEGNMLEAPCYWTAVPTPMPPGCSLDGVKYNKVYTDSIPAAWASCPVKIDDNGNVYMTKIVAGSVGIKVTSSAHEFSKVVDGMNESVKPISALLITH